MNTSDVLLTLLYGVAFFAILYFILREIVARPKTERVVVVNETPVYAESDWWPWAGGPYNYWPYSSGWYSGGGDGGYRRHWRRDGRPWGGAGRGAHRGAGHRRP